MGFGARGMGMGNAMTAVVTGDLVSYYNPAAIPSTEYRNATASMGILTLDRKLNFISYTQPIHPDGGVSLGIINAGVSDIDGRDSDGEQTGPLRTSENEIFLGFGLRFKPGFSLGLNVKLLYYHLYTDVNSTTVSFDLGFLLPINENLVVAATARDLSSKYKWDTSKLFGQRGTTTEDKFPVLYTVGASYVLPDSLGLVAAEVEFSNQKTTVARLGIEVPLIPEITIRAGMDRMDLKEKGNGVRPSFGFSARKTVDGFTPGIHYAYVIEPFASSGLHMVSLSVIF
jgi:hypothetical protein